MSDNNKNPATPPAERPPSTGEGADSALDALKKKRAEVPPADPTLPLKPPRAPS
jgi:hypothetical protein